MRTYISVNHASRAGRRPHPTTIGAPFDAVGYDGRYAGCGAGKRQVPSTVSGRGR